LPRQLKFFFNKIAYNSFSIRDIAKMLVSNRGYSETGYPMINFKRTDPGCHDNEIWNKTGYNSACIENIAVPLAPCGVYSPFGVGLLN